MTLFDSPAFEGHEGVHAFSDEKTGLKSIIAAIGSDEFVRLRIGIQPDHPVSDAKGFVLDEFRKAQRVEVDEILTRAADALRAVVRDGIAKAMSVYN